MRIMGLLLICLFAFNSQAGTFKCDGSKDVSLMISGECNTYLNLKNANPTAELPEMNDCEAFLFSDADYETRRCNFCQVVSDLESHGDDSTIPNLGYFNEYRPDFSVTDQTDASCNE